MGFNFVVLVCGYMLMFNVVVLFQFVDYGMKKCFFIQVEMVCDVVNVIVDVIIIDEFFWWYVVYFFQ